MASTEQTEQVRSIEEKDITELSDDEYSAFFESDLVEARNVLAHRYGDDIAQQVILQALIRKPIPVLPWARIRGRTLAERSQKIERKARSQFQPLSIVGEDDSVMERPELAIEPSPEEILTAKEEVERLQQMSYMQRYRYRKTEKE